MFSLSLKSFFTFSVKLASIVCYHINFSFKLLIFQVLLDALSTHFSMKHGKFLHQTYTKNEKM